MILEDMYQAEMNTHLGHSKSTERLENSDNYRNGAYHRFVKTKDGNLELVVSRDRNGEEDKVIALYDCGMSTRDISDNIREIYGFEVSAETKHHESRVG